LHYLFILNFSHSIYVHVYDPEMFFMCMMMLLGSVGDLNRYFDPKLVYPYSMVLVHFAKKTKKTARFRTLPRNEAVVIARNENLYVFVIQIWKLLLTYLVWLRNTC